MLELNKIYHGDCMDVMQEIGSDSIDCIVTDPPYGMSFMGKNWDKAVPSVAIWQECLRVLKPGAFAFVMCIPRQDCLAHMIVNLGDAGFNAAFSSIYWTYASGFPKAQNLSKVADKRAGAEREVIGKSKTCIGPSMTKERSGFVNVSGVQWTTANAITASATPQAKALDGAYSGFQPKPAVEIIIVAMRPLNEKAYVDQAMANMHGCTWLDDCRIPYEHKGDLDLTKSKRPHSVDVSKDKYGGGYKKRLGDYGNSKGRFPANILCEDNVLDDGRVIKPSTRPNIEGKTYQASQPINFYGKKTAVNGYPDKGSFSRYFDLDTWFAERIKLLPKEAQKTFPWLIVSKASKSEKNRGCKTLEGVTLSASKNRSGAMLPSKDNNSHKIKGNYHPTCKPLKLMSWLITLASRESDTVLDPFCGSGTTAIAAKMLGRQYIGIEREEEYCEIARKRIAAVPTKLDKYSDKK